MTELETLLRFPTKTAKSPQGGAESGALFIEDPDVAEVVVGWPLLSLHQKRIALGMVRKAAERAEAAGTKGVKR